MAKVKAFLLVSASILLLTGPIALAHQPHDNVEALELSPSFGSDGTLFAVSDHTSLIKSTDGGYTWSNSVSGLDNRYDLSAIAFSPAFALDETVFAASIGSGIYRSVDAGGSWEHASAGLGSLKVSLVKCANDFGSSGVVLAAEADGGLYISTDAGGSWRLVIDKGVRVKAISFSPSSQGGAALAGDENGNLYYSLDRGETWAFRATVPGGLAVADIAFSPGFDQDRTIFVGTAGGGVYKSVNGGKTFNPASNGISDLSITSIALSPAYETDSTAFAASSDEAVFVSTDGGASWTRQAKGIYYRAQGGVHYVSVRVSDTFSSDSTVYLASFEGLFRSTNGGGSWVEMETKPTSIVTGIALSPAYPEDAALLVSTYGGGALASRDGGVTWSINNTGLERPYLYDIVVSPGFASDRTAFALQYDYVLTSTDGGGTWTANKIDPAREVFPTVVAVSPDFASDRTLFIGSRTDGVFVSTDGGGTWSDSLKQKVLINSLAISSGFASDGTAYAGTMTGGVIKTTDRGATWRYANGGLSCKRRIVLSISPGYGSDQTVFAGTEDGLFVTSDGGHVWQRASADPALGYGLIEVVEASPGFVYDGTLFASVHGVGLFKSVDRGLNWSEVGHDLTAGGYPIRNIAFSPSYSYDGTLYGSSTTSLFVSTDGGASWSKIEKPARYENQNDFVMNRGTWKITRAYKEYVSAYSISYSQTAWSRSSLTFVGAGVSWLGMRGPDLGKARVYLDGVPISDVDLYAPAAEFNQRLFSASGLAPGPHNIAVEATGGKNPSSSAAYVVVDAFDVEAR